MPVNKSNKKQLTSIDSMRASRASTPSNRYRARPSSSDGGLNQQRRPSTLGAASRGALVREGERCISTESPRRELRLTPTTLRRVVEQRDKLEVEVGELKAENGRLEEELRAHALCPAQIIALQAQCDRHAAEAKKVTEAGAQAQARAAAEAAGGEEAHVLRKRVEELEFALGVSEAMNKRFKARAAQLEELQAEAAALRDKLNEAIEARRSAPSGPSPAQFFAAIEAFKLESLLGCISERVFVHVVAPKCILQVGDQPPRTYAPEPPSDAAVKAFLRCEVEPHFERVFKTLEKTAAGAAGLDEPPPPRAAVEEQRAPDGRGVRAYAERFNSTLADFIKKCVLNS